MPITYRLPYPPTVNHYWKDAIFGKGPGARRGRIRTPKAKAYCEAVVAVVWAEGFPPQLTLTGPLRVEVIYRPPDRRKRDLDNLQKGLLDALGQSQVFVDDNQIWDFRAHWDLNDAGQVIVEPGGSAVVSIWPLETGAELFAKHEKWRES